MTSLVLLVGLFATAIGFALGWYELAVACAVATALIVIFAKLWDASHG